MYNINDYFEFSDVIKALLSLGAGLILGLERELKDKSAGLKTISIITLGSTLFTIMSYKMGLGDSNDSTRIASYVVSGIGFLGAGVIYKEGFSVYGLTTAGIIWVSAAIGMSIGFGEFNTALTFLLATLFVIHGIRLLGSKILPKISARSLQLEIEKDKAAFRTEIFNEIKCFTQHQSVVRFEKLANENVMLHIDLQINNREVKKLEDYLLQKSEIKSFSL